jgi:cytochrome P450
LIQFRRDPIAYMRRLHARHGDVAYFVRGRTGTVFAFGPRHNQQVLSNPALFHAMGMPLPGPARSAQQRVSFSLFNLNGQRHATIRRHIGAPFHKQAVEGYRDALVSATRGVMAAWSEGRCLDMADEMKRLTIGVAGRILFGFGEDEARAIGGLVDRWLRVSTGASVRLLARDWPGTPYRRMLRLAEDIERSVLRQIRQRRAEGGQGADVLSLLLSAVDDEGRPVSDEEVLGQTTILFSAAHETTSVAFAWTLLLLATHPEVARAVTQELQDVLGGEAPTCEQLGQLPVLDRVIRESMRILPPVPYSTRRGVEPFQLGPHGFPAGTTVVFSHFITHHLPEIFEQPEHFNPDRWKTLNCSPYEYLPFGAGPRVCLGAAFATMTLRVGLALMLQRFRPMVLPGARIDRTTTVTMAPRGGLMMRLDPADRIDAEPRVSGNLLDMVSLPGRR